MIYCICTILHEKLWSENVYHTKLVENLFKKGNELDNDGWKKYSFFSLNYDILLDNALLKLSDNYPNFWTDVDYAIQFRNEGDDWRPPRKEKVYLLKLHGSLNWLYCPTCNSIKITPKDKGVMKIYTHSEICEKDKSNQRALIIPPTWQKVYDNPYLVSIWLKAEQLLRIANKVIFIGYSMPESDIHIKYLMKKSLYRNKQPFTEIVVIDREGKDQNSEEYLRYKRLFGQIQYHPVGFENFSENVKNYI